MSQIDYSELKKLATFLKDENMKRIKVSMGEVDIELEAPVAQTATPAQPVSNHSPQPASIPASTTASAIKSPMVGTVYLTPEPNKPAFVTEGQTVQKGDVVCIVEAMKMFTKIKSQLSGTITKICVDNESPVDFNQPLFEIDENV